jgi:hypothetical protein
VFLTTGNIIFLSIPGLSSSSGNPSGIQSFDAFYRDLDGYMDLATPVGLYVESVGENDHDQ